jgi:hypothetical protein
MARTNMKEPLERKPSLLKGELKGKQKRVEQIETLSREELPLPTARAKRIQRLIECAEELLLEIDPTWKPERVEAVKPNVNKAPTGTGRISMATLIVMRQAAEQLTIREIADRVLVTKRVGEVEDDVHERVRNAVGSTLRQKAAKNIVRHDGAKFATNWSLVSIH